MSRSERTNSKSARLKVTSDAAVRVSAGDCCNSVRHPPLPPGAMKNLRDFAVSVAGLNPLVR